MSNQATATATDQKQAEVEVNLANVFGLEAKATQAALDALTNNYVHNGPFRFTDDIDPLVLNARNIADILQNYELE